jgi:hypothetical protein
VRAQAAFNATLARTAESAALVHIFATRRDVKTAISRHRARRENTTLRLPLMA